MKLEVGIVTIVAVTSLLFLLSINTYDKERVVLHEHEQLWLLKNDLMLPSKWRHVTPPTPNSATNIDLNEKNFVATKNGGLQSKMNQHFLPSMQWRPVHHPSPNSNINSNPTLSQQNFASLQSEKEHLFLPSLKSWRPVSPPGSNHGHNSVTPIGEKNIAGSKLRNQHVLRPFLQKGHATSPGLNPGHNSVILIGEKSFVGPKLENQHILLPSLEKKLIAPPTPNPGHNSIGILSGKNFASFKLRRFEQNLGCNMCTENNFAIRKMVAYHRPPLPLVVVSLKATS